MTKTPRRRTFLMGRTRIATNFAAMWCLALVVVLASCTSRDSVAPNDDDDRSPQPTHIEIGESQLTFDPRTCVRGQAGFGWGLGSVRVNVHGRDGDMCVFDFTDEVEGGYTVYRCRVPTAGPSVRIYVDNGDIATSFSLETATRLRGDNLLMPPPDDAESGPAWQTLNVGDTGYTTNVVDVSAGEGRKVETGNRITIRYTAFADEQFDTQLVGIEKNRRLEFTVGRDESDAGLTAAVLEMQAGGRRQVLVREEVAAKIGTQLGGVQPGTILAIELVVDDVGDPKP